MNAFTSRDLTAGAVRAGLPPRRRWLARAGHQAGGRACQPRQGRRL